MSSKTDEEGNLQMAYISLYQMWVLTKERSTGGAQTEGAYLGCSRIWLFKALFLGWILTVPKAQLY